jgi:hypothetical protein
MTTPIQTEVLKRVDSILAALAEAVNATKDFAAAQLPDIAYQYVAYGRGYLTVYMLVGIALAYLCVWAIKMAHKTDNGVFVVPIVVGGVGSLSILVANTKNFIMVWLAPKVWLIQEIANLVK